MKRLPSILLFAAAALFIAALVHLFQLRFASGDVHPEYSSLRSDPLGVKALYDSLDQLIPTRRNFAPLNKLHHGRDSTLLYLGTKTQDFDADQAPLRDLELFVHSGGRLVIAFAPIHFSSSLPATNTAPTSIPSPSPSNTNTNTTNNNTPTPTNEPTTTQAAADPGLKLSAMERWGFNLNHHGLNQSDDEFFLPARTRLIADLALPNQVRCRTSLYFDDLNPAWTIIYDRVDDMPVIIERKFGEGSIVLCADSFLLSNEALLQEREPELLAWLGGQAHAVIFDETHLGVAETPGVVTLMRRYQLHGVVGALLLLAILFVWKNSLSFMPAHPPLTTQADSLVQGRDSSVGFVNLLRRNINPADVLGVCLSEWKQSCSQGISAHRLQQIQTVINQENTRPPRERRPVQTYQAISRILARNPNSTQTPTHHE